jgi:hypothetical protein
MFFEEYINFKILRYLRRCGVIPVQSFGSHIRPQPPGLGLKVSFKIALICVCVLAQLNLYFRCLFGYHILYSTFLRDLNFSLSVCLN